MSLNPIIPPQSPILQHSSTIPPLSLTPSQHSQSIQSINPELVQSSLKPAAQQSQTQLKNQNKVITPLEEQLFDQSKAGNTEGVKSLLQQKANPNAEFNKGYTALHAAAYKGHAQVMGLLIEAGAEKDASDCIDKTPMHYAIQGGHLECVKTLVTHGYPLDTESEFYKKPIDFACEKECTSQEDFTNAIKIAQFLYSQNPQGQLSPSAISASVKSDKNELAKSSEYHVELNDQLLKASENGQSKLVENLLNDKADPNARTPLNGDTPLHIAAHKGHVAVMNILLYKGADKFAVNNKFQTPIYHAIDSNMIYAVKTLAPQSTSAYDLNYADPSNTRPLEYLCHKKEFSETIKQCKSRSDFQKSTNPLIEMVKFFLQNGASIELSQSIFFKMKDGIAVPNKAAINFFELAGCDLLTIHKIISRQSDLLANQELLDPYIWNEFVRIERRLKNKGKDQAEGASEIYLAKREYYKNQNRLEIKDGGEPSKYSHRSRPSDRNNTNSQNNYNGSLVTRRPDEHRNYPTSSRSSEQKTSYGSKYSAYRSTQTNFHQTSQTLHRTPRYSSFWNDQTQRRWGDED